MIQTVWLNRRRVAELVPHENGRYGTDSLSGNAVPEGAALHVFDGRFARFEFRYPAPVEGTELVRIDEASDPAVFVEFSPKTSVYRVLTLQLAPAVTAAGLPAVAGRLNRAADREPHLGKRLSLRMIAAVLLPLAAGGFAPEPEVENEPIPA